MLGDVRTGKIARPDNDVRAIECCYNGGCKSSVVLTVGIDREHGRGSLLKSGVESHEIEGISVRVFNVAKTLADVFRYRNTVGVGLAVEGLRTALRERKVSPAQVARYANEAGIWKIMEPYVTALTHD